MVRWYSDLISVGSDNNSKEIMQLGVLYGAGTHTVSVDVDSDRQRCTGVHYLAWRIRHQATGVQTSVSEVESSEQSFCATSLVQYRWLHCSHKP